MKFLHCILLFVILKGGGDLPSSIRTSKQDYKTVDFIKARFVVLLSSYCAYEYIVNVSDDVPMWFGSKEV